MQLALSMTYLRTRSQPSWHCAEVMPDIFSRKKRSELMRRIKSEDTGPEMKVRRSLHKMGYRYRLHDRSLPGNPDIVMRKHRAVIQVRGCFWHGHSCRDGHFPKSSRAYWVPKLERTKKRDARNDRRLRRLGWKVIVVWECRCRQERTLHAELERIRKHLADK